MTCDTKIGNLFYPSPFVTKNDLEEALARTKAEIIKWVAGMLVAQAAIVATLVKLL